MLFQFSTDFLVNFTLKGISPKKMNYYNNPDDHFSFEFVASSRQVSLFSSVDHKLNNAFVEMVIKDGEMN